MALPWLSETAAVFLIFACVSALAIAVDILSGNRKKMMVMNFVWPITALWSGPFGLWLYWTISRQHASHGHQHHGMTRPYWQSVLIGTSHCGAGCTLGDFVGEWVVFLTGLAIAGSVLWAKYALDFGFSYVVGIVFQYYSIAPMRGLSGWEGIKAAL